MLKGAIFDFDGTLVDSMYIWDNICTDYLRSLGIAPRENLKETFAKLTLEEAATYYRENYGVSLSVCEIISGVNEMIKDFYRTKVTLKNGIKEYLEHLDASGVKMCITTLSDKELVKETLQRLEISKYFSKVFTGTDFGAGKTSPEIYRAAHFYLGTLKKETCVYEDALYAAKTAKADGFFIVGVQDLYEPNQERLKTISDVYIKDYTDSRLKML